MRTLVWLGWVGVVGCRFELPHGDGDVAADPCDEVVSGTQVGDEGTTAGGWAGRILSASRDDAPIHGQILVEGPIHEVPELWVDGVFEATLSTAVLLGDPREWNARSVILPPDGGWPVGAPLEVRVVLPIVGDSYGAYDSGQEPGFRSLAFTAVDVPAPTPRQPSWLAFNVQPWAGNERQTVVTAHFHDDDPWATVWTRGPDGALFGVQQADGDQATSWLFEARESCETPVPLPCVEAQLLSATGEPGPPLSECAPAQG